MRGVVDLTTFIPEQEKESDCDTLYTAPLHLFFFFPRRCARERADAHNQGRKNALRANGCRLNRRDRLRAATGRKSSDSEAGGALNRGPAMPTQPLPAQGGREALRSHSTRAQRRAPPVGLRCIKHGASKAGIHAGTARVRRGKLCSRRERSTTATTAEGRHLDKGQGAGQPGRANASRPGRGQGAGPGRRAGRGARGPAGRAGRAAPAGTGGGRGHTRRPPAWEDQQRRGRATPRQRGAGRSRGGPGRWPGAPRVGRQPGHGDAAKRRHATAALDRRMQEFRPGGQRTHDKLRARRPGPEGRKNAKTKRKSTWARRPRPGEPQEETNAKRI